MKGKDFSWALRKMKAGFRVKRKDAPFEHVLLHNRICLYTKETHVFYTMVGEDILAEDWEIVE
jgi:hypothetical protein